MTSRATANLPLREATDFGDRQFGAALVNVTNICNLSCSHCFVFRADNPNRPKDKMDDATMLAQLRALRDRHGIRSMLFMGGEPMIRKKLVLEAIELFENGSIVTNGTYGIPSVPGHLVTVSLDGPEPLNDAIRGQGVFQKVRESVFARDPGDGTIVMLQMTITKQNAPGIEEFVETVKDWPITGVAFTFYVPSHGDHGTLAWDDLRERDPVVRRVIAMKEKYPRLVKSNVGALEMMFSDRCLQFTGEHGENCLMRNMLPLYMGEGGNFERTFCCYGNDVDCTRCGAYAVFNSAFHHLAGTQEPRPGEE
ncbi:MAG: radical SAM protein [Dehalococcoidia bacterium]|nr:radical SAM protein [Dehalococcoidia bacterium]